MIKQGFMTGREGVRLGPLQLRILQVLWTRGSSTVADVQAELDGEALAYTTVATMLRKMDERGLVRHDEQGRRFFYEAAIAESEVARSVSADLVDRLFAGSLADAVNHLLESRDVSSGELARLEDMVKQYRRRKA
jgi:predicted transcriptional regulator